MEDLAKANQDPSAMRGRGERAQRLSIEVSTTMLLPEVELNRNEAAFRQYVLSQLRCARSRIRLLVTEVETIGVALKAGGIGPYEALVALHEAGGMNFLWPMPPPIRSDEEITTNGKGESHDEATRRSDATGAQETHSQDVGGRGQPA